MRSQSSALGVLLATVALASAGKCDEITPSAVPTGNTAKQSRTVGNQEVSGTGQEPKAVADETPSVPKNWKIAAAIAGHKDVVRSLAFLPDGKRLFSGSFDGEIKVWEMQTRKELASIAAHEKFLTTVIIAPSGELLASAGEVPSAKVKLWDSQTLQLRKTLSYPRPVYCLAFSHKSDLIAAAGENEVYVWSVRDGQQRHMLSVGMWPITGIAFSPDDRILFVGGFPATNNVAANTGILRAFDLSKKTQLGEIKFSYPVEGIALSEDGNTLAIAAAAMRLLDVSPENDRVLFKERFSALDSRGPIFQEQFRSVAFSPSQKVVAGAAGSPGPSVPEAGHVALFTLHDGQRIAQLETPRPANEKAQAGDYNINAVAFSPDGKLLASGGKERVITLWAPVTAQ